MAREARRSPDLHYDKMNVMGFSEVLRKLPAIMRNFRQARALLREFRPDALILVDYPGFNLKMAAFARKEGIPVHYFISPKVWAWKEYRVRKIKKCVDRLYSILPFEVGFYRKHDYAVTYVGNPSVQEIAWSLGHIPPKKHFFERQGIDDPRPIIALLPGSRRGEIRNNLPLMIAAAKRFPDFQYVVGAAPAVPEKFYREIAQDPGLKVVFGCTHTLLKYSQAAVVTSGTATLETALIGTPQVVVYRANGMKISYMIMEKLLKVKYVSLPNLIVGNSIVPELLVHNCTKESIARELSPLLQPSPRRDWQLSGYRAMQRKLGNYVASEYAAELIYDSVAGISTLVPEETEENSEAAGDNENIRRRPGRRPRRRQSSVTKQEPAAGACPAATETCEDDKSAPERKRKPRRRYRPRPKQDNRQTADEA